MITEYGMSDKIGPIQFSSGEGGNVFLGRDIQNNQTYSEKIAYEIDKEMQNFINYCYERAKTILTEHREQLELIAQTLLEVETLDRRQIESLFNDGVLPEPLEVEEDEDNEDVKVNINSKEENEDPDKVGKSYEEVKKEAEEKREEERRDESQATEEKRRINDPIIGDDDHKNNN